MEIDTDTVTPSHRGYDNGMSCTAAAMRCIPVMFQHDYPLSLYIAPYGSGSGSSSTRFLR